MGTSKSESIISDPSLYVEDESEIAFEEERVEEEEIFMWTLDLFLPFFNEQSDEDFILLVQTVVEEHKHIRIENGLILKFLKDNEPGMLSTLEEAKKKILEIEQKCPLLPAIFGMSDDKITADMMPFCEGIKVNLSQRGDIIARYTSELINDGKRFQKEVNKLSEIFKIEVEEAALRERESKDTLADFKKVVVTDGLDPMTKRIPAEKFLLWMTQWMKNARGVTEKIRMNLASIKVHYRKLKALYEQKVELGVRICDIDFERLNIENKALREAIEQKNVHLVELKTIGGVANMDLADIKKNLVQLIEIQDKLHEKLKKLDHDIVKIKQESFATKKSIVQVKQTYMEVKKIIDNCQAPDASVYLKVMHKYRELEKEHKVLSRHEHVVNMELKTYEVYMHRLTNRKSIQAEWFIPLSESEEYIASLPPEEKKILPEFDIFTAINITPVSSTQSTTEDPSF